MSRHKAYTLIPRWLSFVAVKVTKKSLKNALVLGMK
jgi:hypothetical protein